MIVQYLVLAFAFLASGGERAFPDGAPAVLAVQRNILNGPSKPVHVEKALRKKIVTALQGGESELGVFFADYTITVIYQHQKESVLINGKYFKFRSRTYVMKEDVGAMLSQIANKPELNRR